MISIKRLLLFLKFYFRNLFRGKKGNIHISLLTYCDTKCKLDKNTYVDRLCNLHNVQMGSYSYIGYGSSINNTMIGKFCSVASDVKIGLGRHPTQMVSTSPVFYSEFNFFKKCFNKSTIEESSPVIIRNDVWIGSRAIICDGVTIGDGAIIGAGAVVTKDVPSYAIVAGVPAHVIRYRFSPDICEKLSALKWWDWDEYLLMDRASDFHDSLAVINKYSSS